MYGFDLSRHCWAFLAAFFVLYFEYIDLLYVIIPTSYFYSIYLFFHFLETSLITYQFVVSVLMLDVDISVPSLFLNNLNSEFLELSCFPEIVAGGYVSDYLFYFPEYSLDKYFSFIKICMGPYYI